MLKKKRCLLVCEPPTVNTGFGVVSRVLSRALCSEFDTMLFGTGGKGNSVLTQELFDEYKFKAAVTTYPDNAHGTNFFDLKAREFEPDVIYIYYDTGSVGEYITKTHANFWPVASYMMVEGSELMGMWKRMFNDAGYKQGFNTVDFTLSDILLPSYVAQQDCLRLTGRECNVALHGNDHANFRQLVPNVRKELRQQLAQDLRDPDIMDAFIFMYNARNVERKAWPRLFRALKIAKELSPNKQIKLLAHTKVFDNFKLGGWVLNEEVTKAGLDNKDVIWTMDQNESSDANSAIDHGMPFDVPDDNKSVISLVKLYNTADCLVHPSCVEAAGIPILEGARCGLPVLTTDYSSGAEYGAYIGAKLIKVNDFWYHSSGMPHALIDIPSLAKEMATIANNPSLQHQMSAASLKGSLSAKLSWSGLASACVESAERAIKTFESKKIKL